MLDAHLPDAPDSRSRHGAEVSVRPLGGSSRWSGPLIILLLSAALYGINLGRPPHYDELYHILAARGLLETGEPRIGDGLYLRALPFTWMVARSIEWFGDSLWAARIPAVLFASLTVMVLFAWLRREVTDAAAWIGAGLYAISPFAVEIAQFCRFYSLQVFLFLIAAILLFEGLRPGGTGPGARILAAAAAVLLLFFAASLQPTTLIGASGLGLWAAGAVLFPGMERIRRLGWWFWGVAILAAAGLLLLAWQVGLLEQLWFRYRWTPPFNAANRNQFWFYHAWLLLYYPTLWTLVGILALAALRLRPGAASLSLSIFLVGFLLNSFAGSKGLRYLAYGFPFLFALWGMGIFALAPSLKRLFTDLSSGLERRVLGGLPGSRALARSLLAGAVLFLIAANPAWVRTTALLAGITIPPDTPPVEWPSARSALRPWLERADVVLVTDERPALYYLGGYDVLISPSRLAELPPGERHDFGIDPRTGHPVIGDLEGFRKIYRCFATGIVLGDAKEWTKAHTMPPEIVRFLDRVAEPVPLPAKFGVRAYFWQHAATEDAGGCASLPRSVGSARR